MIQLPENIVAMIRKDATDISEAKAIKEGNEQRDKLWKSIKVSRAGDEDGLRAMYSKRPIVQTEQFTHRTFFEYIFLRRPGSRKNGALCVHSWYS